MHPCVYGCLHWHFIEVSVWLLSSLLFPLSNNVYLVHFYCVPIPSYMFYFMFFYQMCFYATKNKGTSCMWWGTSMQKGHSSGRPLGDDWNWDERGGWCAANVRCSDSNPGLLQRGQGLCRQDAHPYQLSCPSGHICCIFIGGILCVKKKKITRPWQMRPFHCVVVVFFFFRLSWDAK